MTYKTLFKLITQGQKYIAVESFIRFYAISVGLKMHESGQKSTKAIFKSVLEPSTRI